MMLNGMKTLDDLDLKEKTVLLRIDINSPLVGKNVQDNPRFRESAKTIQELKKRKAKIIVVAHQGQKEKGDSISLREHARFLNKYTKIKFVNETIGSKVEKAIGELKEGEAVLLENIRFEKDEFYPNKRKNKIIEFFKDKAEVYVNDAFSVSHRDQTSIVSFPRIMESAMGKTFEEELKSLEKIKIEDCLFVLGGNKVEDLFPLLKQKLILATGVFAILCQISCNVNFGLENKIREKKQKKIIDILKKKAKYVIMPADYGFLIKGKRKDIDFTQFPVNARALDIGKKTIDLYSQKIMKAKYVFMKGPAGDYGARGFAFGTKKLLKTMEQGKGFCVISGGHSALAVDKFKINKKKLGYVSLSGGALVKYISGDKLVGLSALERGKNENSFFR